MTLKFNKNGNLPIDVTLTAGQFKTNFGYNSQRKKQIEHLLTIAKILALLGCTEMYLGGSFVTTKALPNDLDVCFDATVLDVAALWKNNPALVSAEGRKKTLDSFGIHIFFMTTNNTEILDFFRRDRNDNKKGLVKILLKNL